MTRSILAAAMLLPGGLIAQVPPPASTSTESQPALAGGPDFISPMGEPVRSPDKLSGAEHWFAQADANHDGRLTLAEFRADALRFFKILDADHDGEIGVDEITRYETELAPEIQVVSTGADAIASEDGSDPVSIPYPDRLGAGRFGYIDLPEPITAMDTNFDRGVSAREYEQAIMRRFAALDTNGDGAITRDELPKLREDEDVRRGRHHKHHSPGGSP